MDNFHLVTKGLADGTEAVQASHSATGIAHGLVGFVDEAHAMAGRSCLEYRCHLHADWTKRS